MTPIEGDIAGEKVVVPARKNLKKEFRSFSLNINGREEGGVVSIIQGDFAVDIETVGKPLVSLRGSQTDVYLDPKQKLKIDEEEVNLRGTK